MLDGLDFFCEDISPDVTIVSLNGQAGADRLSASLGDSTGSDANDQVVPDIFAMLPIWLDQI